MASNEGKVVLPQQHVKSGRGVPGYKGQNIVVVDADGNEVKSATKSTKGK